MRANLLALTLAALSAALTGCVSDSRWPPRPEADIEAAQVEEFLAQRGMPDQSVPMAGRDLFKEGTVLSVEALALLQSFRDPEHNPHTYFIPCSEYNQHVWWRVTLVVRPRTGRIVSYDYMVEEEDTVGAPGGM